MRGVAGVLGQGQAALGLDDDEALRLRFGDDFRRVLGPLRRAGVPAVARAHLSHGLRRRARTARLRPADGPSAGRRTLRQVHDYPWPDPAWMDVSRIRGEALAWGRQYAILGGDWSPFWHDAIDLLGMENLYFKMYDEPELVDAVFGHLVDYYAAVSQRIFDAAADAIDIFFIGNDFGSQTGPLLGPSAIRALPAAAPAAAGRAGARLRIEGAVALLRRVRAADSGA